VDIILINAKVLELPISRRAGAIVYDGTADLGLWRPPGPDRDLSDAYGSQLADTLAKLKTSLPGGELELGQTVRLHPGRLRCDYLIWAASRESHGELEAAAAPGLELLERLAESALQLAAHHDTVRVAFGTAGAGPGAEPAAERMAALVRGANAFRSSLEARGATTSVEEVLVCGPSAADVAKAKRMVERMARPASAPPLPPPTPARRTASRSGSRSTSGGTRRVARPRGLDPDALMRARGQAGPYDRTETYIEGQWFIHPKFGAGQVQATHVAERMVTVLFEDGQQRRLIHARPA